MYPGNIRKTALSGKFSRQKDENRGRGKYLGRAETFCCRSNENCASFMHGMAPLGIIKSEKTKYSNFKYVNRGSMRRGKTEREMVGFFCLLSF